MADVWRGTYFADDIAANEADRLVQITVQRCVDQKMPGEEASEADVRRLYSCWQMPMYSLDFKLIEVLLEALKRQQARELWSEIGQ